MRSHQGSARGVRSMTSLDGWRECTTQSTCTEPEPYLPRPGAKLDHVSPMCTKAKIVTVSIPGKLPW